MPLCVGDKLGPYEVLAPLGFGGMGEVFRARDTRLDRIVAIKVSHEQFSERFEREARAVAYTPRIGQNVDEHKAEADRYAMVLNPALSASGECEEGGAREDPRGSG